MLLMTDATDGKDELVGRVVAATCDR